MASAASWLILAKLRIGLAGPDGRRQSLPDLGAILAPRRTDLHRRITCR